MWLAVVRTSREICNVAVDGVYVELMIGRGRAKKTWLTDYTVPLVKYSGRVVADA